MDIPGATELPEDVSEHPTKLGPEDQFQAHHKSLLAYCARRIGRDEAEDVAADVFAIAWRRINEVDQDEVRFWLQGIARGVLRNRWRARLRRRRLLERLAGLAPNPVEIPEEVVVRRAEQERALSALQRLRPIDREILTLAAWEGMTGPEIARSLGISVSAAEQRLHRAKERYARVVVVKEPMADQGLLGGN